MSTLPYTAPPKGVARVRERAGGPLTLVAVLSGIFLWFAVLPVATVRTAKAIRSGRAVPSWVRTGLVTSTIVFTLLTPLWIVVAFLPADRSALGPVAGGVVGVTLTAIWLAPFVACMVALYRARRSVRARLRPTRAERIGLGRSDAAVRVGKSLTTLSELAPAYQGYRLGGEPVTDRINGLVAETNELFRRLRDTGTPQQLRMATVQYADTLDKVVKCVSPGYLKDVIDNPGLWQHPDERVAEVRTALDAVSEQIVENTRQVNARADLDFQVALSRLTAIAEDRQLAGVYERNAR